MQKANQKIENHLSLSVYDRPKWHAGPVNMYARGIQMIINHQLMQRGDDPVEYETISGDLGVAFAFHASEIKVEAPGYWPVEPICLDRLGFLGRIVGYRLNHFNWPNEAEGMKDPEECYRTWFEPHVRDAIDNNMPCLLTLCPDLYLVTGYSTAETSFVGFQIGAIEQAGNYRIARMPWKMVLPDKPVARIDRTAADLQSLSYAIDLHHDRNIELSYWQRYTGLKAFEKWMNVLDDDTLPHAHLGHAYARDNLIWNRETAIRYLRAMKGRHNEQVQVHLHEAITQYEAVVLQLRGLEFDTEKQLQTEGRKKAIVQIKDISSLESQAVSALEIAAHEFPDEIRNRRPVSGRCYCGQIEYEAYIKENRFSTCNCIACRQATGGMETSNVDVKSEDFRITSGQPITFKAASGAACAKGTWYFCDTCGCSLYWKSPDQKTVAIFAGSLDDASIFRKYD